MASLAAAAAAALLSHPHNPLRRHSPTLLRLPRRITLRSLRAPCRCSSGSVDATPEQWRQTASPPSTIPWSKDLANTIHLIGIVGTSVSIKPTRGGKVFAWTSLSVRKSPSESMLINLNFWDDLAHAAFHHIEKGTEIYVQGRLVVDVLDNSPGDRKAYYKVVVQQLSLIEKSPQRVPLYNPNADASMTMGLYSQNSRGNFEDSSIGSKSGSYGIDGERSPEQLWQSFFAHPLEWWDNRKNKKNPNYPDFRHKETRVALWIDGKNTPPWVKSQLAILDSRMGSMRSNGRGHGVSQMYADEI